MVASNRRRWGFRVVVVGLALAAPGVGGGDARAQAPNWAQALFAEQGHDFGAVPRGAVVRHRFALVNRTGGPISILDVRASCGCTTGRALTPTVPAGATGVVEAQMDTRNFVGIKATTLTVTLVDGRGTQAEARLGVRSNILSDIVLNPGTIEFGAVARGQTPEQVLTIDRLGAPGWTVGRMSATASLAKFIQAELRPTKREAGGVGYALVVRVRPDAPAGTVREEIRLATNDPETPVVPVLVAVEVRGALAASPSLLTLGRATTAGGPTSGRVLIRGAQPFTIRSIDGAAAGWTATAATPDQAKTLHVVTITYAPGPDAPNPASLRHSFRVTTDLPGEPPLELHAVAQ